jgi:hypothetical protein
MLAAISNYIPTFPKISPFTSSWADSSPTFSISSNPTPQGIRDAAPFRANLINLVSAQQVIYDRDLPLLTDIGIAEIITNPLKLFMKNELIWLNTNQSLMMADVVRREKLYNTTFLKGKTELETKVIEHLETLNLTEINDSFSKIVSVKTINVDNIKSIVLDPKSESQKLRELYAKPSPDLLGMGYNSFNNIYRNYLPTAIFLIIGLIVSSYVANDYLYKAPAYRILAFIMVLLVGMNISYTFITFLAIYYLYRYISYRFFGYSENMVVRTTLLPLQELDPAAYENANYFLKFLYIYTLGPPENLLRDHIGNMKIKENVNRLLAVSNTSKMQEQLIAARSV